MIDTLSVLAGRCLNDFSLPPDLEFVVERGSGALLWSTSGDRYVDYLLGSGPNVLGHAHERIIAAVEEQVRRGSTFYTPNKPVLELASMIRESIPSAESVRFVADGSEATFYAMRLARAFTRHSKIIKFEGGFHGHHDYALQSFSPETAGLLDTPRPDTAGIPSGATDSVRVARFNDLASVERLLERESPDVAAVIVEPVQRAIEPLPGFLEGLRTLCDRYGVLLIFDEIVTGFRLARGGAQELFGVLPDLCTLGKVMGGGFPIAAVTGRADIMSLVNHTQPKDRQVYISGTLNGNPIAAAAGVAALQVMDEEKGPERLAGIGSLLRKGFLQIGAQLGIDLTLTGPPAFQELLFGSGDVRNYEDYRAFDRHAAVEFGHRMIRNGIYMRPAAKMYVSLAHDEAIIGQTLETASKVLQDMRDAGWFDQSRSVAV